MPEPEIIEPTAEEIAAAAADEARDEASRRRELNAAAKPKRGPGRPRGSKNKSEGEQAAREAGASSRPTPRRPKLTGAAANSEREARDRKREERKQLVNDWISEAEQHRMTVVRAVGLATGLPGGYLVGQEVTEDGQPVIDGETNRPVEVLTPYGQMLAPAGWQIKAVAEAAARLVDSEQGEKLAAMFERYAPYIYGSGAVVAVGVYAVTTLQVAQAIKPMIEQEMRAQAEAAAAAAQQAPGGSSAGPTG